jgi:hypothetical protein
MATEIGLSEYKTQNMMIAYDDIRTNTKIAPQRPSNPSANVEVGFLMGPSVRVWTIKMAGGCITSINF